MLKLDLQLVDTFDTATIGFADISNYNNLVISNPTFEVTAPGFNKVSVFFTPKQINVFDSADLNIDCSGSDLPDGVYTVKYSIYPNTNNFIEKQFFRVSKLILKYQNKAVNLLSDSYCNCTPKESQKKLQEIGLLIEGVVASSNICNFDLAYKLYQKADDLLNQLNCDC